MKKQQKTEIKYQKNRVILKIVVFLKRQSLYYLNIITMKSLKLYLTAFAIIVFSGVFTKVSAQEEGSGSPVSVGADIVSTYVFRGVSYGGPSIQPYVDLTLGGLTIGAWGSQSFDGGQEMDLYASYGFDFGLSIGLTDYYYPGSPYFNYSGDTTSHAFEVNLGYEIGGFSIAGNYILNEAIDASSAGGDIYFELGYSFGNVDLFVGAGDGWHSTDGEFAFCNIGVGTSKDIKITDSFTLPLSGQVILNPDSEQFFIVAGISF